MVYVLYLILFGFGLAVGSFFNVLALRYNPHRSVFALESIGGRSYCRHCHKTLRWFELIPLLSFIIQRGRCRTCRKKLLIQYPIIEFVSGLVFVVVPFYLNSFYNISNSRFVLFEAPQFYYGLILVWIAVFMIWLLIALIDLRHYLIPNELNFIIGFLAVVLVSILAFNADRLLPFHDSFLKHYNLIFSPFQNLVLNHIFGLVLGGLFFGAIVFLSRGRAMGMGDVKLAAAAGLLFGWADVGLAIIIAFVVGGIVGAFTLLLKKKTMRDKLPFAPFLVLGFVITFFFGYALVRGYFALFNL